MNIFLCNVVRYCSNNYNNYVCRRLIVTFFFLRKTIKYRYDTDEIGCVLPNKYYIKRII